MTDCVHVISVRSLSDCNNIINDVFLVSTQSQVTYREKERHYNLKIQIYMYSGLSAIDEE